MKKSLLALTISGLFLSVSTANANIIDAWQLDTTVNGLTKTTDATALGGGIITIDGGITNNIGHWNLSGGGSTVTQDYGSDGILNAGDTFSQFGMVYTVNYTPNNAVGGGDSGTPANFTNNLTMRIELSGLTGTTTNVAANGSVTYKFDSFTANPNASVNILAAIPKVTVNSDFSTTITPPTDADFQQILQLLILDPSGGNIANYLGGVQANGQTDMLLAINPQSYTAGTLKYSDGTPMDAEILAPLSGGETGVFFDIHTQNTIDPNGTHIDSNGVQVSNLREFTANNILVAGRDANGNLLDSSGAIITDTQGNAAMVAYSKAYVNSDGSANVTTVPEPTSLALFGLGLLGLGAARKKASKK